MELARQELGEEALLVNARPATAETRYLGAYEVVFGIPPRPIATLSPASGGGEGFAQGRLAQEVAGLKRDIERMMQVVLEGRAAASSQTAPLVEGEPGADAAPVEVPPEPQCEVDATLGRPGGARAIVVLVGPPGAGKTTSLIKLAARYGLTARKSTHILSADVYRIAAAEQLRSLAAILGIGCDVAETAGALAQMLEEHHSKELIFVDTPGLARADMDDAAELAELIASHPETDTHLVLPAFMRPSDMDLAIDQFTVFGPRKLLFTGIDETTHYGDLVRAAVRRSLPVSFLGTGQQIPDDLEPADKDQLAKWLTGDSEKDGWSRTRGAAA